MHILRMLMISFPPPICFSIISLPSSSARLFDSRISTDVLCITSMILHSWRIFLDGRRRTRNPRKLAGPNFMRVGRRYFRRWAVLNSTGLQDTRCDYPMMSMDFKVVRTPAPGQRWCKDGRLHLQLVSLGNTPAHFELSVQEPPARSSAWCPSSSMVSRRTVGPLQNNNFLGANC